MSELFSEVDDELRKEQLKKFWDKYSVYIVALAVLIVVGVAGWRGCAPPPRPPSATRPPA